MHRFARRLERVARKKKPPEHENHERWLVSYADFITLLFAFFVVMFATSQSDKGKAQQVSDSVKRALEGEKISQVISVILGGNTDDKAKGNAMMRGPGGPEQTVPDPKEKDKKLRELMPSLQILTEELKGEIDAGEIQISMQPRGLVVSFTQAALFASGEDVISPGAYRGLEKVASAMMKLPNPVRLEGHTDSTPINTVRFHNNWELSSSRSIAILEMLTKKYGVPRERLSVAGYADTAPLATNDTEAGRAHNRRADIVILNDQGVIGEPAKPELSSPPAPPHTVSTASPPNASRVPASGR
jgi:chemotaxis protein MotB